LSSQAKDFTFIPAMDLGGKGNTYNINPKDKYRLNYNASQGPMWDQTSSKFGTWPDIHALRSNMPDIVVRIMFYNPYIFDPTKTLLDLPPLKKDAISELEKNCETLFLQNLPTQAPTTPCNKLFVHNFERGVAFLEYVSTIVYSLMYAYNLNNTTLQSEYFNVSYNVYTKSGTYFMNNLLLHIYTILQIKINSKAQRPSLFNSSNDATRTPSDEVASWVNETMVNTQHYIKYPFFRQDTQDKTKLYIQMHMHPMMHAKWTKAFIALIYIYIYIYIYQNRFLTVLSWVHFKTKNFQKWIEEKINFDISFSNDFGRFL